MELQTVGDVLYWSYANLAMAHAAVTSHAARYTPTHFMIRSKLFKGLCDGTMEVGSLVDEDRTKLTLPKSCCYCGAEGRLSLDHLLPTAQGGPDTGDNVVWACRGCNSSKGARDLLAWYHARGQFPPLLLLRRYLKLAVDHCRVHHLLARLPSDTPPLPFDLTRIPQRFPAPSELTLWNIPQIAPPSPRDN